MQHRCVGSVHLEIISSLDIANFVLNSLDDSQEDPKVIEFTKFVEDNMSSTLLDLVFLGLGEPIAVPDFALFDTECMEHPVSLKPVVSTSFGWVKVVGPILDEDSVEVRWHLARNVGYLI
jgi:hypothetical protein